MNASRSNKRSNERRDKRRIELERMVAEMKHDLAIALKDIPDLEAACKTAQALAVANDLVFKIKLCECELREIHEDRWREWGPIAS